MIVKKLMKKLILKLSNDEQELLDLFLKDYIYIFEKFLLISKKIILMIFLKTFY